MTISVATYLCYMCDWYVDARASIPSWLMSSRNYAVSMAQAVEGRLTATKHKECSAHVALGT